MTYDAPPFPYDPCNGCSLSLNHCVCDDPACNCNHPELELDGITGVGYCRTCGGILSTPKGEPCQM